MTNWLWPEEEPHARVTDPAGGKTVRPARTSKALDDARRLGETRDHVLNALALGCPRHGTDPMDWDDDGAFCHTCWRELRNGATAHARVVDEVLRVADELRRARTSEDATAGPETSPDVPEPTEDAGGEPRRWFGLSRDAWHGVGVLAAVLGAACVVASVANWLIGGDPAVVPMASASAVLFAVGFVVVWLYRDELAKSEQQRKTAIARIRAEKDAEAERRAEQLAQWRNDAIAQLRAERERQS